MGKRKIKTLQTKSKEEETEDEKKETDRTEDELKKLMDEMKKELADMRKYNEENEDGDKKKKEDEEEGEGKKSGSYEKHVLSKMDKGFDEIESKYNKLALAMKRGSFGSDNKEELESKRKHIFRKALRGKSIGQEDIKTLYGHRQDYGLETKAMSASIESDGGFLLRPEISDMVVKRMFETSPVRQLAKTAVISGTSLEVPVRWDEVDSGWVGETQDRVETDHADVSKVEIQAHELYANPRITQILLDDAAWDVEAWMMEDIQEKFGRDENNAFINGTGVAQPKGLLSYASGTGFNRIEQVNSGAAAALTADGIKELQDSLFESYQGNAVWLFKRASAGELRRLKDTQERYLFSESAGRIVEDRPFYLLGKPLHYADHVPAVAAGALAGIYGDIKQAYCIVDRIGIRTLRDPYSSKPYVEFYTTKRVGGAVVNFDAVKIQVVSA